MTNATALRAAVFLDRDGVLNQAVVKDGKPYPPRSLSEVRLTVSATEACDRLRSLGFVLAVVTNQPDIARGKAESSAVGEINEYVQRELQLDSVWMCAHDDADGCTCRKPAPGLIMKAAEHHHVDMQASYLVGDRWRDIEAGRAAGCRTVLIHDSRYTERVANDPDFVAADLLEAAAWIDSRTRRSDSSAPTARGAT